MSKVSTRRERLRRHVVGRFAVAFATLLSLALVAWGVALHSATTSEAVEPKSGHQYRFDSTTNLIYRFALTAASRIDKNATLNGSAILTFRDSAPALQPSEHGELQRAAFAIDDKGRFLTCARVVSDRETVELRLGDQLREAKVLARDEFLDLALLHVDGLPTIPLRLADSDRFAKDAELQVVGSKEEPGGKTAPLVAATKAGAALEIGGVPFTRLVGGVDVGHHGGPILDESGLVAGIVVLMPASPTPEDRWAASAKTVREWLKEAGVELPGAKRGANGQAADALKRAQGSTAMVAGKGAALHQAEKRYLLATEMNWTASPLISGEMPDGYERLGEHGSKSGILVVDSSGHVIRSEGQPICPYQFEPIPAFALGALPTGATNWRTHSSRLITDKAFKELGLVEKEGWTVLRRATGVDDFAAMAMGDQRVAQFTDVVDHKTIGSKGDALTIEFRRAAVLRWRIGERRVESLEGKGRYVFDQKVGAIREASFDGQWELKDGRATVVPVRWTLARFVEKPAPVAKAKKAKAPKIAPEMLRPPPSVATMPKPPPPPPPKAMPRPDFGKMPKAPKLGPDGKPVVELPAALARLLKSLGEEDATTEAKTTALKQLEKSLFDERFRAQVVAVVAERLSDEDPGVKIAALDVLRKWDAAACVNEAIGLLEDEDEAVRHATIAYLGEMNEADAADALIERLAVESDRGPASAALRALGVIVEQEVADIGLAHESVEVRRQCCEILAALGEETGPVSVKALRKLARSSSKAAPAAKDALGKLGLPVDPPSTAKKKTASKGADAPKELSPAAESEEENPFASKKKK